MHNALVEPLGVEAAIGHHQHLPVRGNRPGQLIEQRQPRAVVRCFALGVPNRPGHRNSTTAQDDADGEPHEAVGDPGCTQHEHQVAARLVPQCDDPGEQGDKTGRDDHLVALGLAPLGRRFMAPLAQALFVGITLRAQQFGQAIGPLGQPAGIGQHDAQTITG